MPENGIAASILPLPLRASVPRDGLIVSAAPPVLRTKRAMSEKERAGAG